MRKSLLILLAFAVFFQLNAQTSKRVLFIGNSYIYTNDLPNMLKTLATDCGDTLSFEQSTPGACTFQNHLNNSTTMNFINAGGWDAVVLQEQSQVPSWPIGQVQNECFPYAAQLCERIRATSPDAQITFYMTWGRRDGDASNCANYPPLCTYEGMDSLLALRYMMMAEMNQTAVALVGRVWRNIRTHHPEIELYVSDGSHPSVAGTYAAALTFYTLIFHNTPTCISNNVTLSDEVAQVIRETVETVVYDSLDFWLACWQTPGIDEGIADHGTVATLTVYPNPAHDVVHVEWANPEASTARLSLLDVCGKLVQQVKLTGASAEIDLSGLVPGVYFAKMTLPTGETRTAKIVRN